MIQRVEDSAHHGCIFAGSLLLRNKGVVGMCREDESLVVFTNGNRGECGDARGEGI